MSGSVNKVRHLSAKTNQWEGNNISGQAQPDDPAESKKSVIAFFELPRNWWSSHSSFGASNKLKKLDLVKLESDRTERQNLFHPVNWNSVSGDYKYRIKENEDRQFFPFKARRRLKKILFGIALVFAALIILLFSFMASSIKNF
jgi:hypothetical protein